ncbi:unnamed protein product [Toxocara canis]|uniref:Ovule protein n=1 Tax=Toxocara canis TaxID=6265 RepID=A0A183U916_TOXCA|nr:unnamed protein product [Toxocara canis]
MGSRNKSACGRVPQHKLWLFTTFPNWLKLAFKKSNNQLGYQPYDLNMPSSIPL